jgi:hypothetical protein
VYTSHDPTNVGSRRNIEAVAPVGLPSNKIGVEVEKNRLSGVIVRLFSCREIELPPVGQRQIWRIAERDAFGEASFEPAKETVEASVGADAEWDEGLSRISRLCLKIDVIAHYRLAESQ